MSKQAIPANMDDLYAAKSGRKPKSGVSPTKKANVRQAPTMSDKISDTPTNADELVEFVRVTARISKRHREALEAIARRDGRLLSEVVREAIRRYLQDA